MAALNPRGGLGKKRLAGDYRPYKNLAVLIRQWRMAWLDDHCSSHQALNTETTMIYRLSFILSLTLAAAGLGRVLAEEPASDRHSLSEDASDRTYHRHHIGLFLGAVTRFEAGETETGGALGLEYEYRLAPAWGVGGLLEDVVFGEGRDLALVLPISWHPWRELKLSVGPGVEFNGHDSEFLGRVSVGYDLKIGRFTLAPEMSGDFTRESQSFVYGLTLGWGF